MRVLVVSNGFGEDQIACNLITALKDSQPDIDITVCPLVGEGLQYNTLGLTPILKNPPLPSGGFIRNPITLLKDLKSGLVDQFLIQRKTLKEIGPSIDWCISVGDVFCLAMATQTKRPCYFLPTAKSDTFMKHHPLELRFIKKHAHHTFPRDALTTQTMTNHTIPATYCGNLFLDALSPTHTPFDIQTDHPTLGLLPGSREEAYANLATLIDIGITINTQKKTNFIIAKPNHLSLEKIQATIESTLNIKCDIKTSPNSKNKTEDKTENDIILTTIPSNTRFIITDRFADTLVQSDLIIGLAGTANEQAIYTNNTVICFPGSGPQSSLKRFKEQQKLLGPKLILVPTPDPDTIIKTTLTHLSDQPKTQDPNTAWSDTEKTAPKIITTILNNQP